MTTNTNTQNLVLVCAVHCPACGRRPVADHRDFYIVHCPANCTEERHGVGPRSLYEAVDSWNFTMDGYPTDLLPSDIASPEEEHVIAYLRSLLDRPISVVEAARADHCFGANFTRHEMAWIVGSTHRQWLGAMAYTSNPLFDYERKSPEENYVVSMVSWIDLPEGAEVALRGVSDELDEALDARQKTATEMGAAAFYGHRGVKTA